MSHLFTVFNNASSHTEYDPMLPEDMDAVLLKSMDVINYNIFSTGYTETSVFKNATTHFTL